MEADVRANVTITSEGKVVEKITDTINSALGTMMKTYPPDYAGIHAPMLSIFVLTNGNDFLSSEYMNEEQKAQVLDYFNHDRHPHVKNYIEQFRCSVPHTRIVVIPNGHHYCFLKQADLVYNEMRSFLLEE